MKKVLVISYYWPPAGGAGVQRWLRFVTYLREFGVDPVLFIPENPKYPLQDPSLIEEVPPDIRIYFIAGAQHLGAGPHTPGICQQPRNVLDDRPPILRIPGKRPPAPGSGVRDSCREAVAGRAERPDARCGIDRAAAYGRAEYRKNVRRAHGADCRR